MNAVRTKHAKDRTKDRIGKETERLAQIALENGIRHCETNGRLKRYLDSLYLKNNIPNNMRIYGRCVYLFRGNLLITILDLPKNLHPAVDKIMKRKHANVS